LRAAVRDQIKRILLPRIKDAFQFDVTRMEHYLVACYVGWAALQPTNMR